MDHFAPTVCAVVPCDARHVRVVHEAIESLQRQSLIPTTISLRFSSMKSCPARTGRLQLKKNLFTSCTTSQEALGVVRDIAVRWCRGEEYITYLDADDIALPYALERMVRLMLDHNATVGLHSYYAKNTENPVYNHAKLVPLFLPKSLPPFRMHAHMAHSTMHRSVMIKHHNITIGEDSHFMRDLWNRNAKFVYTNEKLTRYMNRAAKRKRPPASKPEAGLVAM